MAHVRRRPSGSYELKISHRLLPSDIYLTFDTEEAAQAYGQQVDDMLADGVVPAALVKEAPRERLDTVVKVVRAWRAKGQLTNSDGNVLQQLLPDLGTLRLDQFTYRWVEDWIDRMKRVHHLTPGTIRKRVGALGRAIDWYLRSHPQVSLGNPLKLLPRGYSNYTARDAEVLRAAGKGIKRDVTRDRRLLPDEEARVRAALAGERREGRERPLRPERAFVVLFDLILATGVRLREAYTLTRSQVEPTTLRVRSGKQADGAVVYRRVPMVPRLRTLMAEYVADFAPGDLLFPYWDGTEDEGEMDRVSNRLSRRFGTLFAYAGVPDFTEHDLRHEATCRWFEMRLPDGGWTFRQEEIRKIMGWSDHSPMPARYASFRAEDLAARLTP